MRKKIGNFAAWFRGEARRLRSLSSQEAAGEIASRLQEVDGRLGVEVERGNEDVKREIIFTAYSDPAVFSLVHDVVDELRNGPEWKIVPLKPARGFSFSLGAGGKKIEAKCLTFRALADIPLGYQLFSPGGLPSGVDSEEVAWLIVETGVGEELAGLVTHLEFGDETSRGVQLPINELAKQIRSDAEKANSP